MPVSTKKVKKQFMKYLCLKYNNMQNIQLKKKCIKFLEKSTQKKIMNVLIFEV